MEEKEEGNALKNSTGAGDYVPRVKLDNVSTKWRDEGEDCLQNVSLELLPGKLVCLFGHVGAGKVMESYKTTMEASPIY